MLRTMWVTSAPAMRLSPPETAIRHGVRLKCMMFSKQNIGATGTAAFSPKARIAKLGPI